MNLKSLLLIIILGGILFSFNGCKKSEKEYSGTLTILQKDAYSNIAGRSSLLWPPHTTTVFEWELGKEVQLNHGTAPGEKDAFGNEFLVETKVYHFTGTEDELRTLQKAYVNSTMDDGNSTFLNLDSGKGLLEKTFLETLKNFVDTSLILCNGSVTKDSLIAYFDAGRIDKVVAGIESCSWSKAQWELALQASLKQAMNNFGHDFLTYHDCNNDAFLQMMLVYNYIGTGNIKVLEKVHVGPLLYFIPL